MPATYPYIQYGGIWTTSQATDAVAAGTWAVPPVPHLFTWGQGSNGRLGLGNTTYYSSPKQVGSKVWSVVSTGGAGSMGAVRSDGTLWMWGYNVFGELGLGNTTSYSSPKQVGALTNWKSVAVGAYHTFASKTDGTIWAIGGYNFAGQLGTNNTTNYSSPKQVGALTDWLIVGCASNQTVAIKTDGTLWAWGYNVQGQLGLGNTTSYSSPKQVGLLTNWANVVSKGAMCIAVKTDGTLWSWGWNAAGQLGLGNTTGYSSPKQVGALTDWLSVACSGYHSLATKTNNTLWSWGSNNNYIGNPPGNGQLGLGNTTNYSSPKQVGSLTNWLTVSAGAYSSMSAKTDGTLWAWGANNYGQLGLGNTTNYSSPKQIGSSTTWDQYNFSNGGYDAIAIART